MKKVSEVYKELGIDFTLPIIIENAEGKVTYYESKEGFWSKSEYDSHGNEIYYVTSDSFERHTPQSQSCNGKVIEIDGKKYKLTEL